LVTDSIGWPAEIAALRQWYGPLLEARYEDADARHADLEQLEQIATSYGTRDRLLTELALDPPDGTSAQADSPLLDEDYLVLSTIHSAKGREWKAVFVLKCVDGCIPSDLGAGSSAEVEEERRLLYVAMTRAKDHLALLLPQRFYTHQQPGKGDRHVYASRTRFIPAALLGLFESRAWAPGSTMSPAAGRSSPIVNVSAQMREMWT
jgi:DNA helicase-2/ATP-dependent DNA helicase PcrA